MIDALLERGLLPILVLILADPQVKIHGTFSSTDLRQRLTRSNTDSTVSWARRYASLRLGLSFEIVNPLDRLIWIAEVTLHSAVVQCSSLLLDVDICLNGRVLQKLLSLSLPILVSLSDERFSSLILLYQLFIPTSVGKKGDNE